MRKPNHRTLLSLPQWRSLQLVSALLLAMVVVLAACDTDPATGSVSRRAATETGGAIRVSLGNVSGMSLLPDISMQPERYVLRGTGPDGGRFELQSDSSQVLVGGLASGDWTVVADAFNNTGDHIGSGVGNTVVETSVVRPLSITVRPLPGPGTLELSVSWAGAEPIDGRVAAQLIGYDRSVRELDFVMNGATAADYAGDEIPAGYYTLALQLYDGDTAVAGAVETVRIAEAARTGGSFDFSELNLPAGGVDIVITPELDQPLDVVISGTRTSVVRGESMQLSATVGGSGADGGGDGTAGALPGDIFFTWYLNGGVVGNGPTAEVGAALASGVYRLDVVAFSSDGRRSGSTSHRFEVLPASDTPEPTPDPDPEPYYDFIDTFEGDAVDTSKWRIGTWVEHGGQLGSERVYVEDGKLVMVFEYDTEFYDQTGLFKSSAIQTRRDDFGYGRWEARLKPTDIDGVLPTMYTIDWREPGVRTRQEIDIEFVTVNIGNGHSEVHFAVHGAEFSSWDTQVVLPFNPAEDFHVWGFDISPQRIQWFVDDIVLYEYWYDQKPGWIDAPYMLKFNFWSARLEDGGAGWWIKGPPVADTRIYYYIDWVRFTPYSP